MTDNVISLVRNEDGTKLERSQDQESLMAEALAAIDSLRDAVINGRIKAFAAVGVAADHTTLAWLGKTASTTTLELMGAAAFLSTWLNNNQ